MRNGVIFLGWENWVGVLEWDPCVDDIERHEVEEAWVAGWMREVAARRVWEVVLEREDAAAVMGVVPRLHEVIVCAGLVGIVSGME